MAPRWFVTLSYLINRVSPIQFALVGTCYAVLMYVLGYSYSSLVFLSTLVMVLGAVGALKLITQVPRRTDALVEIPFNRAFPSGHAALAAFLGTMVPYTLPFELSHMWITLLYLLLALFALTVALSRLALRVHTEVQVVAGLVIGVCVPLLAVAHIDLPFVQWLLITLG